MTRRGSRSVRLARVEAAIRPAEDGYWVVVVVPTGATAAEVEELLARATKRNPPAVLLLPDNGRGDGPNDPPRRRRGDAPG